MCIGLLKAFRSLGRIVNRLTVYSIDAIVNMFVLLKNDLVPHHHLLYREMLQLTTMAECHTRIDNPKTQQSSGQFHYLNSNIHNVVESHYCCSTTQYGPSDRRLVPDPC